MSVAAANQVIIPGTGHAPPIVGEVGCKDSPAAELQLSILSMVSEQPTRLRHHFVHCHRIAEIVAMHHM
jgi:hypothetical protein